MYPRPAMRLISRVGNRAGKPLVLLAFLASTSFGGAFAAPSGGRVTQGAGDLTNPLQIKQNSAYLGTSWESFDIAKNEVVDIAQPSASALISIKVRNGGGTTIAGTLTANGRVSLENPAGVEFSAGSVVNVGGLLASASASGTSAGAVRADGVITALSGEVHLQSLANNSVVNVGGVIEAQSIIVEGAGEVRLGSTATLTANKEVLVGGGFQGKGAIANAQRTIVESGAFIESPRVIIWSDGNTNFQGNIDASSGFVEISGKQHLASFALSKVKAGELLLDPDTITIDTETTNNNGEVSDGAVLADDGTGDFVISAASIAAFAGDVSLAAGTSITLDEAITKAAGNLTLIAPTININQNITMSGTGTDQNLTLTAATALTFSGATLAAEVVSISSGALPTFTNANIINAATFKWEQTTAAFPSTLSNLTLNLSALEITDSRSSAQFTVRDWMVELNRSLSITVSTAGNIGLTITKDINVGTGDLFLSAGGTSSFLFQHPDDNGTITLSANNITIRDKSVDQGFSSGSSHFTFNATNDIRFSGSTANVGKDITFIAGNEIIFDDTGTTHLNGGTITLGGVIRANGLLYLDPARLNFATDKATTITAPAITFEGPNTSTPSGRDLTLKATGAITITGSIDIGRGTFRAESPTFPATAAAYTALFSSVTSRDSAFVYTGDTPLAFTSASFADGESLSVIAATADIDLTATPTIDIGTGNLSLEAKAGALLFATDAATAITAANVRLISGSETPTTTNQALTITTGNFALGGNFNIGTGDLSLTLSGKISYVKPITFMHTGATTVMTTSSSNFNVQLWMINADKDLSITATLSDINVFNSIELGTGDLTLEAQVGSIHFFLVKPDPPLTAEQRAAIKPLTTITAASIKLVSTRELYFGLGDQNLTITATGEVFLGGHYNFGDGDLSITGAPIQFSSESHNSLAAGNITLNTSGTATASNKNLHLTTAGSLTLSNTIAIGTGGLTLESSATKLFESAAAPAITFQGELSLIFTGSGSLTIPAWAAVDEIALSVTATKGDIIVPSLSIGSVALTIEAQVGAINFATDAAVTLNAGGVTLTSIGTPTASNQDVTIMSGDKLNLKGNFNSGSGDFSFTAGTIEFKFIVDSSSDVSIAGKDLTFTSTTKGSNNFIDLVLAPTGTIAITEAGGIDLGSESSFILSGSSADVFATAPPSISSSRTLLLYTGTGNFTIPAWAVVSGKTLRVTAATGNILVANSINVGNSADIHLTAEVGAINFATDKDITLAARRINLTSTGTATPSNNNLTLKPEAESDAFNIEGAFNLGTGSLIMESYQGRYFDEALFDKFTKGGFGFISRGLEPANDIGVPSWGIVKGKNLLVQSQLRNVFVPHTIDLGTGNLTIMADKSLIFSTSNPITLTAGNISLASPSITRRDSNQNLTITASGVLNMTGRYFFSGGDVSLSFAGTGEQAPAPTSIDTRNLTLTYTAAAGADNYLALKSWMGNSNRQELTLTTTNNTNVVLEVAQPITNTLTIDAYRILVLSTTDIESLSSVPIKTMNLTARSTGSGDEAGIHLASRSYFIFQAFEGIITISSSHIQLAGEGDDKSSIIIHSNEVIFTKETTINGGNIFLHGNIKAQSPTSGSPTSGSSTGELQNLSITAATDGAISFTGQPTSVKTNSTITAANLTLNSAIKTGDASNRDLTLKASGTLTITGSFTIGTGRLTIENSNVLPQATFDLFVRGSTGIIYTGNADLSIPDWAIESGKSLSVVATKANINVPIEITIGTVADLTLEAQTRALNFSTASETMITANRLTLISVGTPTASNKDLTVTFQSSVRLGGKFDTGSRHISITTSNTNSTATVTLSDKTATSLNGANITLISHFGTPTASNQDFTITASGAIALGTPLATGSGNISITSGAAAAIEFTTGRDIKLTGNHIALNSGTKASPTTGDKDATIRATGIITLGGNFNTGDGNFKASSGSRFPINLSTARATNITTNDGELTSSGGISIPSNQDFTITTTSTNSGFTLAGTFDLGSGDFTATIEEDLRFSESGINTTIIANDIGIATGIETQFARDINLTFIAAGEISVNANLKIGNGLLILGGTTPPDAAEYDGIVPSVDRGGIGFIYSGAGSFTIPQSMIMEDKDLYIGARNASAKLVVPASVNLGTGKLTIEVRRGALMFSTTETTTIEAANITLFSAKSSPNHQSVKLIPASNGTITLGGKFDFGRGSFHIREGNNVIRSAALSVSGQNITLRFADSTSNNHALTINARGGVALAGLINTGTGDISVMSGTGSPINFVGTTTHYLIGNNIYLHSRGPAPAPSHRALHIIARNDIEMSGNFSTSFRSSASPIGSDIVIAAGTRLTTSFSLSKLNLLLVRLEPSGTDGQLLFDGGSSRTSITGNNILLISRSGTRRGNQNTSITASGNVTLRGTFANANDLSITAGQYGTFKFSKSLPTSIDVTGKLTLLSLSGVSPAPSNQDLTLTASGGVLLGGIFNAGTGDLSITGAPINFSTERRTILAANDITLTSTGSARASNQDLALIATGLYAFSGTLSIGSGELSLYSNNEDAYASAPAVTSNKVHILYTGGLESDDFVIPSWMMQNELVSVTAYNANIMVPTSFDLGNKDLILIAKVASLKFSSTSATSISARNITLISTRIDPTENAQNLTITASGTLMLGGNFTRTGGNITATSGASSPFNIAAISNGLSLRGNNISLMSRGGVPTPSDKVFSIVASGAVTLGGSFDTGSGNITIESGLVHVLDAQGNLTRTGDGAPINFSTAMATSLKGNDIYLLASGGTPAPSGRALALDASGDLTLEGTFDIGTGTLNLLAARFSGADAIINRGALNLTYKGTDSFGLLGWMARGGENKDLSITATQGNITLNSISLGTGELTVNAQQGVIAFIESGASLTAKNITLTSAGDTPISVIISTVTLTATETITISGTYSIARTQFYLNAQLELRGNGLGLIAFNAPNVIFGGDSFNLHLQAMGNYLTFQEGAIITANSPVSLIAIREVTANSQVFDLPAWAMIDGINLSVVSPQGAPPLSRIIRIPDGFDIGDGTLSIKGGGGFHLLGPSSGEDASPLVFGAIEIIYTGGKDEFAIPAWAIRENADLSVIHEGDDGEIVVPNTLNIGSGSLYLNASEFQAEDTGTYNWGSIEIDFIGSPRADTPNPRNWMTSVRAAHFTIRADELDLRNINITGNLTIEVRETIEIAEDAIFFPRYGQNFTFIYHGEQDLLLVEDAVSFNTRLEDFSNSDTTQPVTTFDYTTTKGEERSFTSYAPIPFLRGSFGKNLSITATKSALHVISAIDLGNGNLTLKAAEGGLHFSADVGTIRARNVELISDGNEIALFSDIPSYDPPLEDGGTGLGTITTVEKIIPVGYDLSTTALGSPLSVIAGGRVKLGGFFSTGRQAFTVIAGAGSSITFDEEEPTHILGGVVTLISNGRSAAASDQDFEIIDAFEVNIGGVFNTGAGDFSINSDVINFSADLPTSIRANNLTLTATSTTETPTQSNQALTLITAGVLTLNGAFDIGSGALTLTIGDKDESLFNVATAATTSLRAGSFTLTNAPTIERVEALELIYTGNGAYAIPAWAILENRDLIITNLNGGISVPNGFDIGNGFLTLRGLSFSVSGSEARTWAWLNAIYVGANAFDIPSWMRTSDADLTITATKADINVPTSLNLGDNRLALVAVEGELLFASSGATTLEASTIILFSTSDTPRSSNQNLTLLAARDILLGGTFDIGSGTFTLTAAPNVNALPSGVHAGIAFARNMATTLKGANLVLTSAGASPSGSEAAVRLEASDQITISGFLTVGLELDNFFTLSAAKFDVSLANPVRPRSLRVIYTGSGDFTIPAWVVAALDEISVVYRAGKIIIPTSFDITQGRTALSLTAMEFEAEGNSVAYGSDLSLTYLGTETFGIPNWAKFVNNAVGDLTVIATEADINSGIPMVLRDSPNGERYFALTLIAEKGALIFRNVGETIITASRISLRSAVAQATPSDQNLTLTALGDISLEGFIDIGDGVLSVNAGNSGAIGVIRFGTDGATPDAARVPVVLTASAIALSQMNVSFASSVDATFVIPSGGKPTITNLGIQPQEAYDWFEVPALVIDVTEANIDIADLLANNDMFMKFSIDDDGVLDFGAYDITFRTTASELANPSDLATDGFIIFPSSVRVIKAFSLTLEALGITETGRTIGGAGVAHLFSESITINVNDTFTLTSSLFSAKNITITARIFDARGRVSANADQGAENDGDAFVRATEGIIGGFFIGGSKTVIDTPSITTAEGATPVLGGKITFLRSVVITTSGNTNLGNAEIIVQGYFTLITTSTFIITSAASIVALGVHIEAAGVVEDGFASDFDIYSFDGVSFDADLTPLSIDPASPFRGDLNIYPLSATEILTRLDLIVPDATNSKIDDLRAIATAHIADSSNPALTSDQAAELAKLGAQKLDIETRKQFLVTSLVENSITELTSQGREALLLTLARLGDPAATNRLVLEKGLIVPPGGNPLSILEFELPEEGLPSVDGGLFPFFISGTLTMGEGNDFNILGQTIGGEVMPLDRTIAFRGETNITMNDNSAFSIKGALAISLPNIVNGEAVTGNVLIKGDNIIINTVRQTDRFVSTSTTATPRTITFETAGKVDIISPFIDFSYGSNSGANLVLKTTGTDGVINFIPTSGEDSIIRARDITLAGKLLAENITDDDGGVRRIRLRISASNAIHFGADAPTSITSGRIYLTSPQRSTRASNQDLAIDSTFGFGSAELQLNGHFNVGTGDITLTYGTFIRSRATSITTAHLTIKSRDSNLFYQPWWAALNRNLTITEAAPGTVIFLPDGDFDLGNGDLTITVNILAPEGNSIMKANNINITLSSQVLPGDNPASLTLDARNDINYFYNELKNRLELDLTLLAGGKIILTAGAGVTTTDTIVFAARNITLGGTILAQDADGNEQSLTLNPSGSINFANDRATSINADSITITLGDNPTKPTPSGQNLTLTAAAAITLTNTTINLGRTTDEAKGGTLTIAITIGDDSGVLTLDDSTLSAEVVDINPQAFTLTNANIIDAGTFKWEQTIAAFPATLSNLTLMNLSALELTDSRTAAAVTVQDWMVALNRSLSISVNLSTSANTGLTITDDINVGTGDLFLSSSGTALDILFNNADGDPITLSANNITLRDGNNSGINATNGTSLTLNATNDIHFDALGFNFSTNLTFIAGNEIIFERHTSLSGSTITIGGVVKAGSFTISLLPATLNFATDKATTITAGAIIISTSGTPTASGQNLTIEADGDITLTGALNIGADENESIMRLTAKKGTIIFNDATSLTARDLILTQETVAFTTTQATHATFVLADNEDNRPLIRYLGTGIQEAITWAEQFGVFSPDDANLEDALKEGGTFEGRDTADGDNVNIDLTAPEVKERNREFIINAGEKFIVPDGIIEIKAQTIFIRAESIQTDTDSDTGITKPITLIATERVTIHTDIASSATIIIQAPEVIFSNTKPVELKGSNIMIDIPEGMVMPADMPTANNQNVQLIATGDIQINNNLNIGFGTLALDAGGKIEAAERDVVVLANRVVYEADTTTTDSEHNITITSMNDIRLLSDISTNGNIILKAGGSIITPDADTTLEAKGAGNSLIFEQRYAFRQNHALTLKAGGDVTLIGAIDRGTGALTLEAGGAVVLMDAGTIKADMINIRQAALFGAEAPAVFSVLPVLTYSGAFPQPSILSWAESITCTTESLCQ